MKQLPVPFTLIMSNNFASYAYKIPGMRALLSKKPIHFIQLLSGGRIPDYLKA